MVNVCQGCFSSASMLFDVVCDNHGNTQLLCDPCRHQHFQTPTQLLLDHPMDMTPQPSTMVNVCQRCHASGYMLFDVACDKYGNTNLLCAQCAMHSTVSLPPQEIMDTTTTTTKRPLEEMIVESDSSYDNSFPNKRSRVEPSTTPATPNPYVEAQNCSRVPSPPVASSSIPMTTKRTSQEVYQNPFTEYRSSKRSRLEEATPSYNFLQTAVSPIEAA